MEIDLSRCEIRTPTGDDLLPLYEMLMDAFPVDRAVFSQMIEKGKRFYTWTPYTLYLDDQVLGNISLIPVRIWLADEKVETVGVASVATPTAYRRKGIAKHLIRHCMNIVDRQNRSCVLFTDLPGLYEQFGFQAIAQAYLAVPAGQMNFAAARFEFRMVETLDEWCLDQMSRLYAEQYPNYNGKVVRDPDYWQLYQMLVDPYPKVRVLFCIEGGQAVGYARLELETDRLLVSEVCCAESALGVAEALLGVAAKFSRQAGLELVTLALPPDHFAWPVLRHHNIEVLPEPAAPGRETFMVRPAAGEPLGPLGRLHWSPADKF